MLQRRLIYCASRYAVQPCVDLFGNLRGQTVAFSQECFRDLYLLGQDTEPVPTWHKTSQLLRDDDEFAGSLIIFLGQFFPRNLEAFAQAIDLALHVTKTDVG